MSSKYQDVVSVLRSRIEHGDYLNAELPSERKIAEEQQVSYMTARKAVKELIDSGLLLRTEDGRTLIASHSKHTDAGKKTLSFAFLSPAFVSLLSQEWYVALERNMAGRNCRLRPVYFVHWEDSIMTETIENFDAIFILPALDPEVPSVIERLRNCGKPVIVLSKDWSDKGFVSIVLRPPESIDVLLEHLADLGHKKIDCFNTQPLNDSMKESLTLWQKFLSVRHLKGEFYNNPVESYGDSMSRAYEYGTLLIKEGNWSSKAVVCMTMSAAAGLMRAMLDNGINPGTDTAVCTINGVGMAKYLNPSLTSLEDVSPDSYIARCLSWLIDGNGESWDGPLKLVPKELRLSVGESTLGLKKPR